MKLLVTLVFISIFFVALVFSVLNFQSIEINLYFFKISLPLAVALTIELFSGIIIGYLVAMTNIMKLKAQYRQLCRQLGKEKN